MTGSADETAVLMAPDALSFGPLRCRRSRTASPIERAATMNGKSPGGCRRGSRSPSSRNLGRRQCQAPNLILIPPFTTLLVSLMSASRREAAGERVRCGAEVIVVVLDETAQPVGEGVFAADPDGPAGPGLRSRRGAEDGTTRCCSRRFPRPRRPSHSRGSGPRRNRRGRSPTPATSAWYDPCWANDGIGGSRHWHWSNQSRPGCRTPKW